MENDINDPLTWIRGDPRHPMFADLETILNDLKTNKNETLYEKKKLQR